MRAGRRAAEDPLAPGAVRSVRGPIPSGPRWQSAPEHGGDPNAVL